MIITNRQLFDGAAAIRELTGKDLPIKLSYKLSKIAKTMEPMVAVIDDLRKKLIEKYAAKDDEGNLARPDGDVNQGLVTLADAASFNKDFNEVLDETTEIEVEQIQLGTLGDITVTPATLIALDWLIIE